MSGEDVHRGGPGHGAWLGAALWYLLAASLFVVWTDASWPRALVSAAVVGTLFGLSRWRAGRRRRSVRRDAGESPELGRVEHPIVVGPRDALPFEVGDRVVVGDGYDGAMSAWLRGGDGYSGTIVEIAGTVAVVELDDELQLIGTWQDFGDGGAQAIGTVGEARGRWLALLQGSVGGTWTSPTGRLQVGLCRHRPRPGAIPPGGGIGCWVESHAAMSAE